MQKYWPYLFLLAIIEGTIALAWLGVIPADPKNAIFLGFSMLRLMMVGGLLIGLVVIALIGYLSWHDYSWREHWLKPDNHVMLYRWATVIAAVLAPGAGLILVFLRYYDPGKLASYFIRSRPLLVYMIVLGVQLTIWLFTLRFWSNPKAFWGRIIPWIFTGSGVCLLAFLALSPAGQVELRTWWYIQTFDPRRYELHGSDYCFQEYHDGDEDKFRLAIETRKRLAYVDRYEALRAIFSKVTDGAKTDKEKHLRVLAFIQKSSYHTSAASAYSDGDIIYDPLVLIELGDMYCTQGAVLAIDLFGAMGYPARMVQLGHHQIAEIYYGGDWHYFDTDLFGNRETVLDDKGNIPSVAEMSRGQYQKLDALAGNQEFNVGDCNERQDSGFTYPSYFYFSSAAYQKAAPFSYMESASGDYTFLHGWKYVATMPGEDVLLSNFHPQSTPSKPVFSSIHIDIEQKILTLSFASSDSDHDLAGYRIFVASHSRGWDYNQFYGDGSLSTYWANLSGWKPEMYARLFELPPSDVALIKIGPDQSEATIPLASSATYFITVMPFDVYGEGVGRILYPASNEIRITMP
jgi:hypothetical protein